MSKEKGACVVNSTQNHKQKRHGLTTATSRRCGMWIIITQTKRKPTEPRAVTTASIARDGHEQAGHLVVEVAVARDTLHPQRRLRARCLDGGRRAWGRLALDEQQQRLG